MEPVQHVLNAPVPSLLILAGAICLLLGLIGKVGAYVDLDGYRQKVAAVIGGLLLVIGLVLYLTSKPTSAVTYRVVNVQPNDVLNIRGDTGENKPIIGSIPPDGRGIQVINKGRGVTGGWVRIKYKDAEGWVNSYYLTPE
jgi:hypothetical protein